MFGKDERKRHENRKRESETVAKREKGKKTTEGNETKELISLNNDDDCTVVNALETLHG